MTIVYAIAVLGVLAIVFGLILAIAAKVFEVSIGPDDNASYNSFYLPRFSGSSSSRVDDVGKIDYLCMIENYELMSSVRYNHQFSFGTVQGCLPDYRECPAAGGHQRKQRTHADVLAYRRAVQSGYPSR